MWGQIAAAGASSAASIIGQEMANRANRGLAGDQMNFQERMSSTAHQREVMDLRAAGLNPILSAIKGAGASTPSGAMAKMENTLEGGVTSAMDSLRLSNETKLMGQDFKLKEAQALSAAAAAQRDASTAKNTDLSSLALSHQMDAIAKEAGFRSQKAAYDQKWYNFDRTLDRVSNGLGSAGSALSAFTNLRKFGPLGKDFKKEKWPNADEMRENKRQDMFKDAEKIFKP